MIQAVTGFLLAASEDFQPQDEFTLHPWVSIELGPIDLSINKAVVYLLVGAALTCLVGIWIMRFGLRLKPSRKQTMGESMYELVQTQIAEGNLPKKALRSWFPYCAALFFFIWVLNIVGFIPLADLGRALHDRRGGATDLGDLRGNCEPVRDPCPGARHLHSHARRGAPLQRRPAGTSRAGFRAASRAGCCR